MLRFVCSGCGKHLVVKGDPAGKRVKCPSCGQVMEGAAAASPGPSGPAPDVAGSSQAPPAAKPLPAQPPTVPAGEVHAPAPAASSAGPPPAQTADPPLAEAVEPPAQPPSGGKRIKKNRKVADILGISACGLALISCIAGVIVGVVGTVCCIGWLAWPLVLVLVLIAVIGGVLAILYGDLPRHRILAIVAFGLSVIAIIIPILVVLGVMGMTTGMMRMHGR